MSNSKETYYDSNSSGRLLHAIAVLVLMTISMRSVNNMITTTIPPFAVEDFHFTNVLIGAISAVSFGSTFLSTTLLNPYLKSEARKIVFRAANISLPFLLLLLSVSDATTIWFLGIWSGIAYGVIVPNVITSAS
ncbi:MAG: hypothetical protein QXV22_04510, partial [Thermoplasmataceae archaeon]